MKVLHVFNQPRGRGGSLALTRQTIASLEKRDHEVRIFTRDSLDLPGGLKGKVTAAVSGIYAREAVKAFKDLLDEWRPDIVHSNELFPLVSPWVLPECKRRKIPVVMNCDDYHMSCPVRTHVRKGSLCHKCLEGREYNVITNNCRGSFFENASVWAYSYMLRKTGVITENVDHFITPSDFSSEWLADKLNLGTDKVTTVSPVIPCHEDPVDPGQGEYIAFAGRFVPEKGIDLLIEASTKCDVPIALCRSINHLNEVEVPEDVQVVVNKDRDELDQFYRKARVLIVPSLWYETFGLVGAEAMSHGVPVIASKIGAVQNLIEDGKHGFHFETGNSDDLAEKMTTLWEDPSLCRQMGEAAYQRVKESWTEQAHYDGVIGVYEKVLHAVE